MIAPEHSELTAADLMTADPRTCSPFSTVVEAVLIFRDADCGAVPVIDAGKPVGVVTDRDVALAVADYGDRLPAMPVTQIMTRGVVAVAPGDSIGSVVEKFGDERVRRLLVMDSEGLLLGIIAWADIAPFVSHRSMGRAVTEVVEKP
jgi:CBS domain-containing protein